MIAKTSSGREHFRSAAHLPADGLAAGVDWINPSGGTWATVADWSTGSVPGSTSNVLIAQPGNYVIEVATAAAAASITLSDPGATLAINALLTLTGVLDATAGTVTLARNGRIQGGTLLAAGGGNYVLDNGGTLNRVDLQGTLVLEKFEGSMSLASGFAAGSDGSIDVTGEAERVSIDGYTTLNGVALTYNVAPENYAELLSLSSRGNVSQTFIIGQTASLNVLSGFVVATADNSTPDILKMAILNRGTISVGGTGSQLDLGAGMRAFTNSGEVEVSNGGQLIIFASDAINTGTFTISGAGSQLEIYFSDTARLTTWTNNGSINVSAGGTLNLAGLSTLAQLDRLSNQGGTIAVTGVLVGPGTLALPDLGGVLAVSGSISNATIIDPSGTTDTWQSGAAICDVQYQGTLTIANISLTVQDITFADAQGSGAGTIVMEGAYSALSEGGELNNVSLLMGDSNPQDEANINLQGGSNDGTYTWGAGFTLTTTGGGDYINNLDIGSTINNQGTLISDFAGGQLNISQYDGSLGAGGTSNLVNSGTITAMDHGNFIVTAGDDDDTFSNSGLLSVSAGGTISLLENHINNTGEISATGTGSVLTIGTEAAAGSMFVAAWFNDGMVSVGNGALLDLAGFLANDAGGVLTGGTYTVASFGQLDFPGGAITTDAASIRLSGANAVLNVADGTITTELRSSLATIAASGSLALSDGASFKVGASEGSFSDNGALTLSQAAFRATTLVLGTTGTLSGNGTVSGQISNAGQISAAGRLTFLGPVANQGGMFAKSGVLTVDGALTGSGTLTIDANASAVLAGTASGTVAFFGDTGELQLGDAIGFAGQIVHFNTRDSLDLLHVTATSLSYDQGVLNVVDGTATVASLHLAASGTPDFVLTSDGQGGSFIKLG